MLVDQLLQLSLHMTKSVLRYEEAQVAHEQVRIGMDTMEERDGRAYDACVMAVEALAAARDELEAALRLFGPMGLAANGIIRRPPNRNIVERMRGYAAFEARVADLVAKQRDRMAKSLAGFTALAEQLLGIERNQLEMRLRLAQPIAPEEDLLTLLAQAHAAIVARGVDEAEIEP